VNLSELCTSAVCRRIHKIMYLFVWNNIDIKDLITTKLNCCFLLLIIVLSELILIIVLFLFHGIQATFFTTYVLSSGWATLACEIIQPFPLFCNLFQRLVLCSREDSYNGYLTFPYHTEVPRVLLFGFLGFTCSILAPLILPFLLFYFFLAYIVYRNQVSISPCFSVLLFIIKFIGHNFST
jgi:hypothetical protein